MHSGFYAYWIWYQWAALNWSNPLVPIDMVDLKTLFRLFTPIQLNWSFGFLRYFGWIFFQEFAWVWSFLMSFWVYFKKVSFWKYLMIKRLFLGVPLSFPPKNGVFIQFGTNSTQPEFFFCLFLLNFAWVFAGFSLSFEFFGLELFHNVQKKPALLPIPITLCIFRWNEINGPWRKTATASFDSNADILSSH